MPDLSRKAPIPGGLSDKTPLHGSTAARFDTQMAVEAERRAQTLLGDASLHALVSQPKARSATERSRQIFVNRNLRLGRVDVVGFDMDYTLAIYHMRRLEQLSFDMTLTRLVAEYGYPPEIGLIHYDHQFGMRGLFVDKEHGNLLKMDRFGHVGRAHHGRRELTREQLDKLYRHMPVRVKNPRFAWIDTLFALPESCMFAGIIELLEGLGHKLEYAKLYDDIREAIDLVHRDNSLKRNIRHSISHYIFKDPELGPALHKLRSSGKKIFLLTNSLWDYTDAVMSYLLDDVVNEYPSWRNYFDYVITGASKPAFFSDRRPFLEIDQTQEAGPVIAEAKTLERGKVYQGGNLLDFEKMAGYAGDTILYVGDHIFGDILKSKKESLWRTCMIVQEIEDEIAYTEGRRDEISRLSQLELVLVRLDDELNSQKTQLNLVERQLEKSDATGQELELLETEHRELKANVETLRRHHREAVEIARTLADDIEEGFNPYWGLLFKEGNENSRFGEQVEQYACVYTSRVSNLLHYSPVHYFRSPRDLMPHERAGALSGKLSPMGSEGPPRAASQD